MKYFIFTLFILNAFSFSLNDDWNGVEEAIKIQQDAILDLVDQLDIYSDIPITQQIDNQVQQLINPSVEIDQIQQVDEQNEVHSLEYWLDRLGDEYQDETILLQQPQSIIDNIDLQNNNENIQMEQLLNQSIQLKKQENVQQLNEISHNTLEVLFNSNNEKSSQESIINQDNNNIFKDDITLQVLEREQYKDINNNFYEQLNKINKEEKELNKSKQSNLNNQNQSQDISNLKQYLLQPEVISDLKSININEDQVKIDKKQQINIRDEELIIYSNVNEQQQVIENSHKFISFKVDPKFEQINNSNMEENIKSIYDELPETKLQSKEDMKREKEQKIQEMQKLIEIQLKNKTLQKQSEIDKSLQYESQYLQWERITQNKLYPDINFVMTQNNLRKRL